ncbi:MAG: LysR family transcriptional regulator [Clostridiales bacterium]|nr:LysR family transcriptional regulator [Clostridiales bacterium]
MEIRQLKYFIAAAEQLNFTKAAKKCHIVQTAMPQQIANLENELDIRLFERSHRSLSLTPAGEHFLKHAKTIVAFAESSVGEMADFRRGYRNILRIGYHGEMFKRDITEILKEFRRKCPDTKIYLIQETQDQLIERAECGEVDLVFTIYADFFRMLDWMETEILDQSDLKVVVSRDHPLADRGTVAWEELKDEYFIEFEEKGLEEHRLEMLHNDMVIRNYGRIFDHTSGEILIESGYAVSLWTGRMCREEDYPKLRFLDIEGLQATTRGCVIYRKNSLSEAGRTLIDEIKRYERRVPL